MTEKQRYEIYEILQEIMPEDTRPALDEFLTFLYETISKCQPNQIETVREHFLS